MGMLMHRHLVETRETEKTVSPTTKGEDKEKEQTKSAPKRKKKSAE